MIERHFYGILEISNSVRNLTVGFPVDFAILTPSSPSVFPPSFQSVTHKFSPGTLGLSR
jgi:hypothetical protein